MSEQNLDAIRSRVEQGLSRQKWNYRIAFFVAHVMFFVVAMLAVWGTVANDSQLRDILFNSESGAAIIVILPTILWTAVLLFHIASLYFETGAGEKAMREQLLMREVGKDILRYAEMSEKPKRRELEVERTRLSDDGELIPVDEGSQQRSNNAHANHAGSL
jgi:hypothetical protein